MHAYLLICQKVSNAKKKIAQLAPKAKIIIPFEIKKIADSRELARIVSISQPQKTVYFLKNFDQAGADAQNAFLKTLEEVQENIIFVLSAKNDENILPTITSRCHIIKLNEHNFEKDKTDNISFNFTEISKISKKDDALYYLETLIYLLKKDLPKNAEILKYANEAYIRIKANANPTLQLTWLLTNSDN
jgi:DNA polymerase III, gamma/tau subunits